MDKIFLTQKIEKDLEDLIKQDPIEVLKK